MWTDTFSWMYFSGFPWAHVPSGIRKLPDSTFSSSFHVIFGRACSIRPPLRGAATNESDESLYGLTHVAAHTPQRRPLVEHLRLWMWNLADACSPMKRLTFGERLFLVRSVTEASAIQKNLLHGNFLLQKSLNAPLFSFSLLRKSKDKKGSINNT